MFACAFAMFCMIRSALASCPSSASRAAMCSASVVPAVAETTTMRSPVSPPTIRATLSSAVGDATDVPPNFRTVRVTARAGSAEHERAGEVGLEADHVRRTERGALERIEGDLLRPDARLRRLLPEVRGREVAD